MAIFFSSSEISAVGWSSALDNGCVVVVLLFLLLCRPRKGPTSMMGRFDEEAML